VNRNDFSLKFYKYFVKKPSSRTTSGYLFHQNKELLFMPLPPMPAIIF